MHSVVSCSGSFASNLVMFLQCQGSQYRVPNVFVLVLPEVQSQLLLNQLQAITAHKVCCNSWIVNALDSTKSC